MSSSRKHQYPGVSFPTTGYGAPAAASPVSSPLTPSSTSYAYPQPGSLAYAATQGPNGVTYQPVVAQSVTYQTPQGPVQAIQYVPATSPPPTSTATSPALGGSRHIGAPTTVAGSTYTAGYPGHGHTVTGQRPAAVPVTPPVAYDNKRYGDILFGRSEKDQNRAMKQWQREQKEQERQSEKRGKEHRRKEEKEAAKKMEEWDREMRERQKAEELELRRAREADRKANHDRQRRLSDAGAYPDARGRTISGRGLDPDLERRLRELQIANDTHRVAQARSRSHVRAASSTTGGLDDPNTYERRRRMSATYTRDPYFPGPGHPVGSISANPSPSMGNAALVPASPYHRSQSSSYRSSPYHGPIDRSPGSYYSGLPGRPTSGYEDPALRGGGSGRLRATSFSHPSPRMPSPQVDPRTIDPRMPDPRLDPRFEVSRDPPAAFNRPPNQAHAYTPFEAFWIIRDINQMLESLPLLPPLPAVLVPHDVLHEDWERYMVDIIAAWQGRFPPSKSGKLVRLSRRGYVLSELIDQWNDRFLVPRGVEMVLFRDRERFSGPQASVRPVFDVSDSEESESSDSESDDDEDRYGGGLGRGIYGVGQSHQEKMQRRAMKKEKRAERKKMEKLKKKADRDEESRVYGLFLGCTAPAGGGRSPMRPHIGF